MRYHEAFEALLIRGIHPKKVEEIMDVLYLFRRNMLAQAIALMRGADMELREAAQFLNDYTYPPEEVQA